MKVTSWTYHKTGTVLLGDILRKTSRKLGYEYIGWEKCSEKSGKHKDDKIQRAIKSNAELKGVHCVRHPFEIVASGYKYHKRCNYEAWLTTNQDWDFSFNHGKCKSKKYREILNDLNQRQGLIFEIHNASQHAIRKMSAEFDEALADERFINIRLEDMSTNFNGTCAKIAKHFGVDSKVFCEIASEFDKTGSKLPEESKRHITNPSSDPYTYDKLLDPYHKCEVIGLDTNVWKFMKQNNYGW